MLFEHACDMFGAAAEIEDDCEAERWLSSGSRTSAYNTTCRGSSLGSPQYHLAEWIGAAASKLQLKPM